MTDVLDHRHAFLVAGGEMGARMRAHDWAMTPLGSLEGWSSSLRAATNMMLNSPESMFLVWGPELIFLFNDAYCPTLGPRLDRALGQPLRELWPDAWEAVRAPMERALVGKASRFENAPITLARFGVEEETWWSYSYSPLFDNDGRVAGVLCLSNETTAMVVSERNRAATQIRLSESEAQLRALNSTLQDEVTKRTAELRSYHDIVQSNRDPICAFDTDYRLTTFNRAHSDEFFRIFGHRVQVGEVFPDLFPPDQAPIIQGFMARALAGETYTISEEFGDPDLSKPSWEVAYTPLRGPDGEIVGAFHYAKDISGRLIADAKLRTTQEALRHSQKIEAVGRLTGGVAHDFNNLLTVIRSSIDLLKRKGLSEERRGRYVAAISDTVDRAAKITGQLLAFARRQALKPEVFAPCQGVRMLQPMMGTLVGPRIQIVTELPERPYFVNADPSQFDAALVNVAANARDAMEGNGLLTIVVRTVEELPDTQPRPCAVGPFVAVSVTDTGCGIPSDQLKEVFEPFFTTKETGKGTGLGLSQVFGFAKQSGGDVIVVSEVGVGTTLTVYLPRVDVNASTEVAEKLEPLVDGQGLHVLVVEDNREVGDFTRNALAELGYHTVLASSAEEALVELAKNADRFDVVFSDVVMPGMGGIELAQHVRRDHCDLPILLTSGYSHVLAQHGTDGFELVHKPYSIEELSRILCRAASHRRHASISEH